MSEGEVVGELVEFTNILLVGVSLIFSIVSAYVVALNYFIGSSNMMARIGSFAFITLILRLLMIVMSGAQATHAGLLEPPSAPQAGRPPTAPRPAPLPQPPPGRGGG